MPDFEKRNIRIVAISVDTPGVSKQHSLKVHYTIPLLSDTGTEVIRRYDLLHPNGGPHKEDISRPAEFLVDSTGTVRWRNLTGNIAIRLRPEEVLAAFDALPVSRD